MIGENYLVEYDKTDPVSIEKYSQKLIGKTFRQVINEDENHVSLAEEPEAEYGTSAVSETKRNKGNLGQIIEERFFHYACNSDSRADFYEAGVELKVTPYKINKNGSLVAKERLILTMIDYCNVVSETFEESHFWKKSNLILLIYYLYMKELQYNLDYKIGYSRLFTPPEQDIKIIMHDYYTIVDKIKAGKAHELSEGDTMYLGAAPKGATSQDRRKQPFSDIPAKPRAFAFKTSYMTFVLNNYIVQGVATYKPDRMLSTDKAHLPDEVESIITDDSVDSFEEYVVSKIELYHGFSKEELCEKFGIDKDKKQKNLESMLVFRILGIKGNHAEEFEKAGIVVKTIRIENNNKIKESMSFPVFKFKELIEEEWDDSEFGNYLRETRFLFVIYKRDENGVLRLKGSQFWNIPYNDLETEVRSVWEKTKKVIMDGLKVTKVNGINQSNLPKASENPVCHVRPHGQNAKDTYELPDGRSYPKQCFWLNNSYILSQIEDRFKK